METLLKEGFVRLSLTPFIRVIALGYSKKILKSLWKGDDECRFEPSKKTSEIVDRVQIEGNFISHRKCSGFNNTSINKERRCGKLIPFVS